MNSIGRVNYVSFDRLSFEISDFDSLEFNQDGSFYFTKGILDFVTIVNKQNDKFIYQVEKLEDKEQILSRDENAKFSYTANVWATPIGVIKENNIYFNLKTYPFLQNEVYLTSRDEFEIIFNQAKPHTVNLGKIGEQFNANIDINKLLTYHSAILGNTGSGKSTTIRQVLSEIGKQNTVNLHVHVLDVHNEYENLATSQSIDVLNDYSININSLELQDWINLVKPSDLVQLPVLRMALQLGNAVQEGKINETWLRVYIAHQLYFKVQTDAVAKRSKIVGILENTEIDISKYDARYGNFPNDTVETMFTQSLKNILDVVGDDCDNYLQNEIEQSDYKINSFDSLLRGLDFVFLLEESKGNTQARTYSATLETRVKEIKSRYSKLFAGNIVGKESDDVVEKRNDKIIVYNVSHLDDDLLLFFSSYIGKLVFNNNKQKEMLERDVNVLLLEEAHRYVSRDKENSQLFEVEIFKRIAREGRKFGIFLWLSSQRPSELSGTVLSQINNFMLHRIKNNVDLEYMSKTIPYITQNQLKRLSFLPTGVTYAVGELFPIPIEVEVNSPEVSYDVTQTPTINFGQ
jgi:DNA helicase HerA-like ATPase